MRNMTREQLQQAAGGHPVVIFFVSVVSFAAGAAIGVATDRTVEAGSF